MFLHLKKTSICVTNMLCYEDENLMFQILEKLWYKCVEIGGADKFKIIIFFFLKKKEHCGPFAYFIEL